MEVHNGFGQTIKMFVYTKDFSVKNPFWHTARSICILLRSRATILFIILEMTFIIRHYKVFYSIKYNINFQYQFTRS